MEEGRVGDRQEVDEERHEEDVVDVRGERVANLLDEYSEHVDGTQDRRRKKKKSAKRKKSQD